MPQNNISPSRNELVTLLHQGLLEMKLSLSEAMESQLMRYIDMLAHWNKVYQLTNIRDKDVMVTRHLLDSLSIINFIKGSRVIDVGTGAGLPGVPLAIAMPDHQFVLLESNQRKIRFLQKTCYKICLQNVRVVYQRVEDYQPNHLFDTVISRSFGTLHYFLKLSQHLVKPNGQMLAMKGIYPLTELEEVSKEFKFIEAVPIKVPGLNADRHIVEFCYLPQKNTTETA